MYNQIGGALSNKTIENMKNRGAPSEEIRYATQTQFSMDPNDVRVHRGYINQYNPSDPWKQPNNFVMHPNNYIFGGGQTSPQYIGGMLGTLPGPVYMSGPPQVFHPAINPYIVYRPF